LPQKTIFWKFYNWLFLEDPQLLFGNKQFAIYALAFIFNKQLAGIFLDWNCVFRFFDKTIFSPLNLKRVKMACF
jgi:hypothetical protein